MTPNLSFEQAPPISVPYRFFMTAPLFGIAAGLLLVVLGPEAFASRWTGGALATAHLLAAGMMLQAMCGALMQFVPVAAGGNVWRPKLLAAVVHPILAAATLILALAFLTSRNILFYWAAVLFAIALGVFIPAIARALATTPAQGPSIRALRFAIVGLAVTIILGMSLAIGVGGARAWPLIEITHVHVGWGLGGWSLMLLMGVSYFVVPMFQITPPYPLKLAGSLPPMLFALLLLWSVQLEGTSASWQLLTLLAGLALAAIYAVTTLRLQRQRRRKVSDPTLRLFAVAMYSLIAIGVSVVVGKLLPSIGDDPRMDVWVGVLAMAGTFVSVICGMLYKIVPFINWLHLQRLGTSSVPPPNMREMIPERAMVWQVRIHFLAVALLLAASLEPELVRPAGGVFALSCCFLAANLFVGVRSYCRFRDRILANAADC